MAGQGRQQALARPRSRPRTSSSSAGGRGVRSRGRRPPRPVRSPISRWKATKRPTRRRRRRRRYPVLSPAPHPFRKTRPWTPTTTSKKHSGRASSRTSVPGAKFRAYPYDLGATRQDHHRRARPAPCRSNTTSRRAEFWIALDPGLEVTVDDRVWSPATERGDLHPPEGPPPAPGPRPPSRPGSWRSGSAIPTNRTSSGSKTISAGNPSPAFRDTIPISLSPGEIGGIRKRVLCHQLWALKTRPGARPSRPCLFVQPTPEGAAAITGDVGDRRAGEDGGG